MTSPQLPTPYEPGMLPGLFQRPAIFLSASDPYLKGPDLLPDPEARALNEVYYQTRQPARIRDAVGHLCRFAFTRGIQLIFGGHPAISPLVLHAARRLRTTGQNDKLVVVFQSLVFFARIPPETLALADWTHGTLLWTASRPATGTSTERDASLTWMRQVMVQAPNLVGAVFIGGMDGVEEEAALFRAHNPGPMFAIGSTGSAADVLLDRRDDVTGRSMTKQLLRQTLSYPLVMEQMFADLDLLGDAQRR